MSNFKHEPKEYFCGECGTECYGVMHDFGGSYEAWGQSFTETKEQFLSDCCGAGMYYDKKDDELSNSVPVEEYHYG